ncbi:hypothetical protein AB1L88_17970 [Tautonia sp. JC769]|uniref:hypothetical protein n=1 Tax=Tautonia sp. JC769 TaxID=3232135 RepID=UPI0034584C2E
MNPDRLNFWLAILTFVATVAVLLVARSAAHRKAAWRIADVARKLGLGQEATGDPGLRRWLDHRVSGIGENDRSIVWELRGSYEGRAVILLGIHERPGRAMSWRSNDDRAPGVRWIGWFRENRSAVPRPVNQLLVLLDDPVPGLPEFRIGPDSAAKGAAGGSTPRAGRPASVADRPAGGLFEGLAIDPPKALSFLPQAFLDRTARVLVGRRHPWEIEGYDGRLGVRIARWQSHSRARSYQSVLDEALSLRAAWDDRAERSDEVGARRSVRSALERIRRASGPSASTATSEAELLRDDREGG